ncbi:MAG: LPS assembly lipoprotein LptE [Gammaproteobacteria bacterium]|nr:LPS assembly lipoprotein LptE [Gammaproteobacteria bacterium]
MRTLAAIVVMLVLAGCGFHLRTAREDRVPARFAALHVTMPGSGLRYPQIVLVVSRMLQDHGATVLPGKAPLPTVELLNETLVPVVVTINSNGGAAAYLLDYSVSFVLKNAQGRTLLGPGVARVQREYNLNPLNILAMAREERYLENRMRRSAARQIVARLIAFRHHPAPSSPEVPLPPAPFATRHAH